MKQTNIGNRTIDTTVTTEQKLEMSRWQATDSILRDRLLSAPHCRELTSAQLGELRRLSRFLTGDRVRQATLEWLRAIPKELRSMRRLSRPYGDST